MKDIVIIGAGGFGREVLAILRNINAVKPEWNILGFLDKGKQPGELVNGCPVIGDEEYLNTVASETAVVIAIALPIVRKAIYEQLKAGKHLFFPTIIHPTHYVSDNDFVSIGQGNVFCINTVLTTNITIGDFVIVNAGVIVNHDAVIGDFCTLMPGTNISTGAQIGEGCYIGTGSKIAKPEVIEPWQNLPAGTIIA